MKKSFSSLLFIIVILLISGNLSAEYIRIGYFGIPPHSYKPEGASHASGAAVELFSFIAGKMGYDVLWVELPAIRLIRYLKEGKKIDGVLMFAKESQREKYLNYPLNPFYRARPNFIVRSSNPLSKITSGNDIRGYTVGQFSKAANSKFIEKNKSLIKLDKITPGKNSIEQHLFRLILGRVDAVHTIDEYSVIYEAKRLKKANMIKVLFLPEPTYPLYTAFCKNKKGEKLSRKYDIVFKKYRLDGDYIRFIRKEFLLFEKRKNQSRE